MSLKAFLSAVLFVSTCTCVPAYASNNGIELQAFANSTNAIDVARRQIACTPTHDHQSQKKYYYCSRKGYTRVPPTVWIATTHFM